MPIQLLDGASVPYPVGDLQVQLAGPPGAGIALVGVDHQLVPPLRTMGPHLVLAAPAQTPVAVEARMLSGQPFPEGTSVGVSIRSFDGQADEIVRPRADVSGRRSAALVRIHPDGRLEDLFGHTPSSEPVSRVMPREWHKSGAHAYHTNHTGSAESMGRWALVIDSSASMLHPRFRPVLGGLLQAIFAIAVAARGGGPTSAVLSGSQLNRAPVFDSDEPDWLEGLGMSPAPWSRLMPDVRLAQSVVGRDGFVLVLVDGPPVDTDELLALADESTSGLTVLAIARSRFEIDPGMRLQHAWEDEIRALAPLPTLGRHVLASISQPELVSSHLTELADGLFPIGR